MSHQPNFNHTALDASDPRTQSTQSLLPWFNERFQKIAGVLRGPNDNDVGLIAASRIIRPQLADLTTITLGANLTLTLDISDSRTAAYGFIQLLQDGTGARTVTWVNALTNPAISATANKRTMLLVINVGKAWVLSVLASGY